MNTDPLHINQFEAADMLLEFIDQPEHHNQMFDANSIQEKVFPTVDVDTIQYIFQTIENSYITPQVANFEIGSTYIKRTVGTTPFLKNGGFTKLHKQETFNKKISGEAGILELQQLRTNVQLLTNQLSDYQKNQSRAKRNELIQWISIIVLAIGLIVSLITKKGI